MSTPFVGQLMLCSWNFAPKSWAQCNGQLLAINQNQALFSLLGTYYGGDGRTTFALPNLQGQTPIGAGTDTSGTTYVIGEAGGEALHTLTQNEVPSHSHPVYAANGAGNAALPSGALLAGTGVYAEAMNLTAMNSGVIAPAGGGQGHENRQPFLVMNWCIALNGIFPTRN